MCDNHTDPGHTDLDRIDPVHTNHRHDLGLTGKDTGCACGHGDHTASAADPGTTGTVTTNLLVEGMTCSHCVSSVTEELTALDGVQAVTVQLNAGGSSKVTVTSQTGLDPAAVRAAIDEAGYALTEA